MTLPRKSEAELAEAIRLRAIEIAAGEGDVIAPPPPAIQRLREPTGIFGIHWTLADWQRSEGRPYIDVAAAEASAQWEIEPE